MIDLPQLREGQNVSVTQKIVEGKRERSIPFAGRVMKVRGIGVNKTITVRQTLEGIGVDRIFPVLSPTITQISMVEEKKNIRKSSKKGSRRTTKKSKTSRKTKAH